MSRLKSTMKRLGRTSPHVFVGIVKNAFHLVEAEKYATDMPAELKVVAIAIFSRHLESHGCFYILICVLDLGCVAQDMIWQFYISL